MTGQIIHAPETLCAPAAYAETITPSPAETEQLKMANNAKGHRVFHVREAMPVKPALPVSAQVRLRYKAVETESKKAPSSAMALQIDAQEHSREGLALTASA